MTERLHSTASTVEQRECGVPRSGRNPFKERCELPEGHDGPHHWSVTAARPAPALRRVSGRERWTGSGEAVAMRDRPGARQDDAAWQELTLDECLRLLREHRVGRIAVVVDGFPKVFPVNYRIVETCGATWITVGTRRGHDIDRGSTGAAFEIDSVDPAQPRPWSVVVCGTLHHVDPDAADFRRRFDPDPWESAPRRLARRATLRDHRPPARRRRDRRRVTPERAGPIPPSLLTSGPRGARRRPPTGRATPGGEPAR